MEEKKINKSITFSIVAILLLIIVIVTSSYAYFRAQGESDVQEISTANLGIDFIDGELFSPNLEPIERDDMLTKAAKKTFMITNTGDEKLFVHISMEDIVLPEKLKRFDFMWSLYEGDKNVSNGSFEYAENSVEIGPYQVFEKGASKTYHLYVWIEETGLDQSTMMGQTFSTIIKADAEAYHTSPESDFTVDSSGVITAYTGTGGDVIIPEKIGDIAVTHTGSEVLKNKITSVVIPNGVTTIGEGSFWYNGSIYLESAIIPNSVTRIGGYTFYGNKLTNVSIPNSVTSIAIDAFNENNITSVVIPSGITTILYGVFKGNDLTNIIIPSNITSIGENAFSYNQLTNVIIGKNVTSIDSMAFANNPNLEKIVIRRANSEGITFGNNWNCSVYNYSTGTCTKYAEVIYHP